MGPDLGVDRKMDSVVGGSLPDLAAPNLVARSEADLHSDEKAVANLIPRLLVLDPFVRLPQR